MQILTREEKKELVDLNQNQLLHKKHKHANMKAGFPKKKKKKKKK
jgi:hypothetical protein